MCPDVPALVAAVILNERVLTGVFQQAALDLADRAKAVWHGYGGRESIRHTRAGRSLPNPAPMNVLFAASCSDAASVHESDSDNDHDDHYVDLHQRV